MRKLNTLIWCYTKIGDYDVKTEYHLQRKISNEQIQQQQGNDILSHDKKNCYSKIWKLNLPPKPKVFLLCGE